MRLAPLFALAAAFSCGKPADPDPLPFEPAGPMAAPAPAERGPFPVGVRTVTYEDTGRPNEDGGARMLTTEIWYPATQASRGGEGVSYDLMTVFTEDQKAQLLDAGVHMPLLETDAVRDAPPAVSHGPFPLVVFSHGHGAMRWQSTYLTVVLASHGYVVAAPDHEHDLLSDLVRSELADTAFSFANRPLDVRYLINRLSRLPAGDLLTGVIDLNHVGVVGHSFGALTAFRVTAIDPRVQAIVPQAPVTTDISLLGYSMTPHVPVEIMGARLDQTLPYDTNVTPSWSWATKPRWLLTLETAGHFTFSDLCQFDLAQLSDHLTLMINIPGANPDSIKKVLGDGCGGAAPPASVALPMIDHFTIAFFNGHLRGSPGSLSLLSQEKADGFGAGVATVQADP